MFRRRVFLFANNKKVVSSSLLTGIVAYWNMNEYSNGSGAVTRNDSMGISNLTDVGLTTSAAGVVGLGASFVNAQQNRFTCPSNSALQTGDIDWNSVLWVYPTAFITGGIIMQKVSGGNKEYVIQTYNDGSILVYFGTKYIDGLVSITLNAWNMISFYHDSVNDLLGIQVNNSVAKTVATSGVYPTPNSGVFEIGGKSTDVSKTLSCYIDEVGIWKRLLTTAEKTQLWNSGGGKTYPFS